MDFNNIIAMLFKRFQTLSPRVWAFIIFLLGTAKYALESGYAQGVFVWVADAGVQQVLGWVTWFLTAVVGYGVTKSQSEDS